MPVYANCDCALTYDARELAKALGVSKRHVWRMDASGLIPRAVWLGRAKRWLVNEIREWLGAGAPPREKWERIYTGCEVTHV